MAEPNPTSRDEDCLLDNFVNYVLAHIDDIDGRLTISGWKVDYYEPRISAEQFEMADAFLRFLKGKYIIQVNYKNSGSSKSYPFYKMRDRNRSRLNDPVKRYELIQEFLGVYNSS